MEATNKEEELQEQEVQELKLPTQEDYRNLYSNAIVLYDTRDFEGAAEYFKRIYENFPEQIDALINYGNCQSRDEFAYELRYRVRRYDRCKSCFGGSYRI